MQFKVANRAEDGNGNFYAFGWGETVGLTDEQIESYSVDLMLSSQDGEAVEVLGLGRICEIMALTGEKQEALGIDLGKSGLWLGVRVRDKRTWKGLMSNQVFEISDNVSVQNKPGRAGESGSDMELKPMGESGCAAIVAKCANAARTGNYANISKGDVEAALDRLAATEAEKRGISVEQGYDRIMQTEEGRAMYACLDALRPGTAASRLSDFDGGPIRWSAAVARPVGSSAGRFILNPHFRRWAGRRVHGISTSGPFFRGSSSWP